MGTPTFTNATVCVGGSTVASATVSGGAGTLSYQWQYYNGSTWANTSNGTPAGATYTNATTTSLTIAGTTATGAHQYRLRAYNTLGCETFGTGASFTVNADPTVGTQPTGTTICAGTNYVISTSINNGTGLNYQWQYYNGSTWVSVGANLPAAGFSYTTPTAASMTINTTLSTPAATTYQFRCSITSGSGCDPTPLNTNGVTVNVVPGILNVGYRTWTGLLSTAWDNALNWDCGGIPTLSDNVIIPATTSTSNYPVIVNGVIGNTRTVRIDGPPSSVEVQNGGTLNVAIP